MMNLTINTQIRKDRINPEIYGHFAEHLGRCIYEGIFVGEESDIPNVDGIRLDVLDALKKIRIPVLRWPGGCFAEEYNWRSGIGDRSKRPQRINVHWGGVIEDNSFGTHDFMRLCELLDCKAYINGNMSGGTVREMSDWVEYLTFDGYSTLTALREENGRKNPWKVEYFGVGNENWGAGGNMRPEYYADEYRKYQTVVRNYGDNQIYKVACGPNSDDYYWTDVIMKNAGHCLDGISLHYYTLPTGSWDSKGSDLEFDEKEWYSTLKRTLYMEELVTRHSEIMNRHDPEKRVGLIVDEWGTWYDPHPGTNPGFLYQQNTMRDALVAGINLNIFNQHCDRVHMANIAQTANVLQSIILTDKEKMILTPTYHVFDLYKHHMGGALLETSLVCDNIEVDGSAIPQIHHSASISDNGIITITICNLSHDKKADLSSALLDYDVSKISGKILSNEMNAHNTFNEPQKVAPSEFSDFSINEDGFSASIPPCSVVLLRLEK